MAILIQATLNLPVGDRDFKSNVPANVREIKVTLTTAGWPSGECLVGEVFFPSGESAGRVGFAGGGTLNRFGLAECSFGIRSSDGGFLPSGRYTVRAQVLQAINTTITVDGT